MGALREQMDGDLVVRGMSVRTREAYLGAVAQLAKYYQRTPDRISEQEVQQYLLYLIQERKLAWSSCNVAAQGLRFFYRVTLKKSEAQFAIPHARQPQKLPQILAREEIEALFQKTINPKHRAILMVAYGAGLRLNEIRHLKVSDIDSARMTLRVEQGKGAKDRYTLLSPRLLAELRGYWKAYRPAHWLFPGKEPAQPISDNTVQRIFEAARVRAGIVKKCGIHGLRHAFATHLLEAGVDIHTIQRLMGHGHISSTLRYFHLARKHLAGTPSPLELLEGVRPR
ncbi:MAG: integrase [Betaproteobacteria bacterium RIFCSPLOWO2_12_FULL_65_14]|nr:MAG: integrase [Betaproteobacteria bacterium RIFCSPLOWO2_12_FULL_65_14]